MRAVQNRPFAGIAAEGDRIVSRAAVGHSDVLIVHSQP